MTEREEMNEKSKKKVSEIAGGRVVRKHVSDFSGNVIADGICRRRHCIGESKRG